MDIEMATKQSLDSAMTSFISNVKNINDQITEAQLNLMTEVSNEFSNFAIKLKEELNKERDQFVVNMEINADAALDEYNVEREEDGSPKFDLGSTCELLVDDNKDAVDDIVTQFQEKIDQEATAKDSAVSKGWQNEWRTIQTDLYESQHMRGRNIINEIITTAKDFGNAIGRFIILLLTNFNFVSIDSKFQKFRDDDEEGGLI